MIKGLHRTLGMLVILLPEMQLIVWRAEEFVNVEWLENFIKNAVKHCAYYNVAV
jgi:hypothetical protein